MAANSGGSRTRKIYYNVSYGMLSTNAKTAPEGYEEISISELKSKRSKFENVDLRNKFIDTKNGKEYPLRVFYTDVTGVIQKVEKSKYTNGTSLSITILDTDGDECIIQSDFYGKEGINLMNRLISIPNEDQTLNFRPYSIPSEFTPNGQGEPIKYFNSGVSIKIGDDKIKGAFNAGNGLPATEQFTNGQGEQQTSRVKQSEFVWSKIEPIYSIGKPVGVQSSVAAQVSTTPQVNVVQSTSPVTEVTSNTTLIDDLPF